MTPLMYGKIALALLLSTVLFFAGRHWERGNNIQKIADLNELIAKKNQALGDAANALSDSANALRQQNAENKAALAQAKEREDRALDAAVAAAAAEKAAKDAAAKYRRALDAAAARRPECKSLLDTDVRQVCAV